MPRHIVMLLLLASTAINFVYATEAESPARLALWVTDDVDNSSADKCLKSHLPVSSEDLPLAKPTITEHDVIDWDAYTATWTLNTTRFNGSNAMQKLQNHCYILAIDGKLISSGVMLAPYSARLTKIDTMIVYTKNNALHLQLTAGNHAQPLKLIHQKLLDDVLGHRAL